MSSQQLPLRTDPLTGQPTLINVIDCHSVPMRQLDLVVIVLLRLEQAVTSGNTGSTVHTFVVADQTAAIQLTLWDQQGQHLKPGDIIRLGNAFTTRQYKDLLRLSVSTRSGGTLMRLGEYTMTFTDTPNLTTMKQQETLNNGNNNERKETPGLTNKRPPRPASQPTRH